MILRVLCITMLCSCVDLVEHGNPVAIRLGTVDCEGVSVIGGVTQLRFVAKGGEAVVFTRTSPADSIPNTLFLPPGAAIAVRVDALDASGQLLARGTSIRFEVPTPAQVSIDLFPVDRFTRLCNSLVTARAFHSATELLDGRVLIIGGQGAGAGALSSMEVLTESEVRDVGPLALRSRGEIFRLPRSHHTAILTDQGQVVVSGGESSKAPLSTVIYVDPPTGFDTGAVRPGTVGPRSRHASFVVGGGLVMIGGTTSEFVANPAVDRLDFTSNQLEPFFMLPEARLEAAVAQLDSIAVLAGGLEGAAPSQKVDLVSLDGARQTSRLALSEARRSATAVRHGVRVLVAGGLGMSGEALGSTEWITTGSVSAGPSIAARASLCAVALPPGRTLLLGGVDSAAAEIIDADGSIANVSFPGPARHGHSCLSASDGSVLVVGGLDAMGQPLADLWRFTPGD